MVGSHEKSQQEHEMGEAKLGGWVDHDSDRAIDRMQWRIHRRAKCSQLEASRASSHQNVH